MHASAKQFLTVMGNKYQPVSVLELGSCDVNGAVREYFPTATRYVGVDIQDGPGVDVVCDAAEWRPEPGGTFDLVVSSSTFEHTPVWPGIVETAAWHCRTGGHVAFTTVRAPFPKHNARGGDFDGTEYYADVTETDLQEVMRKVGFTEINCLVTTIGDVAVCAQWDGQPVTWRRARTFEYGF